VSRRVLEVQLSGGVSQQGVSALVKLNLLREFFFEHRLNLHWISVLGWCFKELLQLHAVGQKPDKFVEDQRRFARLNSSALSSISSFSSPCTLNLRWLAVSRLRILMHVMLPELEVLSLNDNDSSLTSFTCLDRIHLAKLTQLDVVETGNETLMSVVGHFGHQLSTLRFQFQTSGGVLQLDRVLTACPKLSELDMDVVEIQSATDLLPGTLRCLKVLRLRVHHYGDDDVQPGLVLQLLRLAPNLRTIELFGFHRLMSVDDLLALIELVERGACMCHLQRLQVSLHPAAINYIDLRDFLDLLIISCGVHCKQLREVIVGDNLTSWSAIH
jgi:hypothetical protein